MINFNKILFLYSFILMSFNVSAQNWHWQADLNEIPEDAYYKINISPNIISASVNNGGDIRIFDNSANEIPYILEKEQAVNLKEFFVEYKIITNQSLRKWPYYSKIVIHNPKKNEISNFQLIIRNADVSKNLKLSGSDDASHWYVIKDKYRFRSIHNNASTSVIKIINFPNSNYEYYEILIDDWRNNPLQIQKAGYFDTAVEEGKYAKIIPPQIKQKELKEEKQSLVHVQFNQSQLINKIQLKVEGPEFYYREAEILLRDSNINKKKKVEYYYRNIHSFIISSNSLNNIYFDDFRTKEFFIRINNHDDKPIVISAVNSWQLRYYLIAKLNKNTKYSIKTGNFEIFKPQYDLAYFKNDIPENISSISIGSLSDISDKKVAEQNEFKLSKMAIWLIIGGIAILLVYFTTKMMKDMKIDKKN